MQIYMLALIAVAAAWILVVALRTISGARFHRDLRAYAGVAV
jgi:hypothetical protein